MSAVPTTIPLAADFADRLEAVRNEAAGGGHSDIDHILEMAVAIARQRIEAQGVSTAVLDADILRPLSVADGIAG